MSSLRRNASERDQGCNGVVSAVPLSTGLPRPSLSVPNDVVAAPNSTTVAAVLLHNAVHSLPGESSVQYAPLTVKCKYAAFSLKVALGGQSALGDAAHGGDGGFGVLELFFREVCGVELETILQLVSSPELGDACMNRMGPGGEFAVGVLYALQHLLREVMVLMSSQDAGSPSRCDAMVTAHPDKQLAIPALSRLDVIMTSVGVLSEGPRELPQRRWMPAGSSQSNPPPLSCLPENRGQVPELVVGGVAGVHSASPVVRYLRMVKVEWDVASISVKSRLLHHHVARWASQLLGPYPNSWPNSEGRDRVHPPQGDLLGDLSETGAKRRRALETVPSSNVAGTLHNTLHVEPVRSLAGRQMAAETLLQRMGGSVPKLVPTVGILSSGKFSADMMRSVSLYLQNGCLVDALSLARVVVKDCQKTESNELIVATAFMNQHIAAIHAGSHNEAATALGLVLASTRSVDTAVLGSPSSNDSQPKGVRLVLYTHLRITALLAVAEMLIHFPAAVTTELQQAVAEIPRTVHHLLVLRRAAAEELRKLRGGALVAAGSSSGGASEEVPSVVGGVGHLARAALSMGEALALCLPLSASRFKSASLWHVDLLRAETTSFVDRLSVDLISCDDVDRGRVGVDAQVRAFVSRAICAARFVLNQQRSCPRSIGDFTTASTRSHDSSLVPAARRHLFAAECLVRGLVGLQSGPEVCADGLLAVLDAAYRGLQALRMPPNLHDVTTDSSLPYPLDAASVALSACLLHLIWSCGNLIGRASANPAPTQWHSIALDDVISQQCLMPPKDHQLYAIQMLEWLAGGVVRSGIALGVLNDLQ